MPPARPPRRRGNRGGLIVAVVVGLVAVAAGGYFLFAAGGDDGGPSTPADKDYEAAVEQHGAAEVAWRVTQAPVSELAVANGTWLTDKYLVRRLPRKVVAYDLVSGDKAWELALDGPERDDCLSSRQPSNNRIALLRSTGDTGKASKRGAAQPKGCGKLTVLDLGTGKEVFTTDVPPDSRGHLPKPGVAVPVVLGDRVVVDTVQGRVFDLASGAQVPAPKAFGGCAARGLGRFGDLMLADSTCRGEHRRLRAFDKDFRVRWEWTTPKAQPVLGVLSADPLVVEVGYLGHDPKLLLVDKDSGKAKQLDGYTTGMRGEYMGACAGHGLRDCHNAKVAGGKVILMTSPDQINPDDPEASPGAGSTEFRNELVAFDVGTGKEAWRTGMVGGRLLGLVPTADDTVVAFQPVNPNGTKAMVFGVDPAGGKVTPLMPIGPNAMAKEDLQKPLRAHGFGGDNFGAVWRDGLFVIYELVHRGSTVGDVDTVAFKVNAG